MLEKKYKTTHNMLKGYIKTYKMKNILKTFQPNPILLAVLFTILSLAIMFITTNQVSAQAGASATCTTKINADDCKAKVTKECGKVKPQSAKDDCEHKVIARFKDRKASGSSGSASGDESIFETGSKKYQCGNTKDAVETKFNIGCLGGAAPAGTAPIHDMAYSFLRFLSAGIGIIIVISIIAAGIQYSSSEGSAEATQAAKTRIQNSVIGLIIYIFSFSLIQYLVPGGIFAGVMTVPDHLYILRIMELI